MKIKWLIFCVMLFIGSHYLHLQINRLNHPYYNTVFPNFEVPQQFYNVSIGNSRSEVEKRLGKPFFNDESNRSHYSKKNEGIFSKYWLSLVVSYRNDTVISKSIYSAE